MDLVRAALAGMSVVAVIIGLIALITGISIGLGICAGLAFEHWTSHDGSWVFVGVAFVVLFLLIGALAGILDEW